MLRDKMSIFLTKDEIDQAITRLANEVENDFRGEEVTLVCPLKGSFIFLADFVRKLSLPNRIDFVFLQTLEKHGTIRFLKDISLNIEGANVLIVEEIIDNGRTLSFLKQRLLASLPATLRVMALLDKPARRELPIQPDYTGFTIDDRYVVGYGMDSEQLGRNYDCIYSFTQ